MSTIYSARAAALVDSLMSHVIKQYFLTLKRPKFGFCFPASIFSAVDFPMPFVPTRPRTSPGRGVGNRWSLKELAEYRCVVSFSRFDGKFMMEIASNGHFYKSYIKIMLIELNEFVHHSEIICIQFTLLICYLFVKCLNTHTNFLNPNSMFLWIP